MPKNTVLITYLVLVHRSKWVQPNMTYQHELHFCNILLPCNQNSLHTHGIEHPWDPWVRREDRVLRRKRILPFIPKYYRYSKCFLFLVWEVEYNGYINVPVLSQEVGFKEGSSICAQRS